MSTSSASLNTESSSAIQGAAAASAPNESTKNTLRALKEFIDKEYPLGQGIMLNTKVHDAFKHYREAVSRPNPVYEYILNHLDEGFSRDEIKIFVAGLGLRVLPTSAVLGVQDCFLRAAGIHDSVSIIKNFSEEAGGARGKSHIELFYRKFADIVAKTITFSPSTNLQFHPMTLEAAEQCIDYSRAHNGRYPEDLSVFNGHLNLNGHITASYLTAANDPLYATGKLDGWERPANEQGRPASPLFTGMHAYKEGLALAKLIPHKLREYGEKIWQNQYEIMQPGPKSMAAQLKSILALLTREQNADKLSHIDAAKLFADKYLGGSLWADIHVGNNGVEGDHADDARNLFMRLLKSGYIVPHAAREDVSAMMAHELIAAFDYVVDKDYCKLQQDHMQAMVEAMQKARKTALAKGEQLVTPHECGMRQKLAGAGAAIGR